MPASTATTVTKTNPSAEQIQSADSKNDFFWTYTEEPHRTRRLAIIKAHPEVQLPPSPELVQVLPVANGACPDHKTLRSRAPYKVCRRRCRHPASCARLPPPVDAVLVIQVLGCRLRIRCNREPESLPSDPRDLTQFGLQEPAGESAPGYLRELAYCCAV